MDLTTQILHFLLSAEKLGANPARVERATKLDEQLLAAVTPAPAVAPAAPMPQFL